MNDIPEDAIDTENIIQELQASFDDSRYSFRDVAFDDTADHEKEMQAWRAEMSATWEHLVNHTMELWDYSWGHIFDSPCNKRTEWLFRRKESPFKNCGVEECRRALIDAGFQKPRELEQFYLFMQATLAQGATMWGYSECKREIEMDKP